MKIEILNEIIEKTKTKKDGVYSHKGYKYCFIKDKCLMYVENRQVYQVVYSFVTPRGKKYDADYQAEKAMREFFKTEKG